jgi:hypothetical protein
MDPDPDADPDPAIFVSYLQGVNKSFVQEKSLSVIFLFSGESSYRNLQIL